MPVLIFLMVFMGFAFGMGTYHNIAFIIIPSVVYSILNIIFAPIVYDCKKLCIDGVDGGFHIFNLLFSILILTEWLTVFILWCIHHIKVI